MFISRRTALRASAFLPFVSAMPSLLLASNTKGFTHSVASGDPGPASIRLWTRFVADTPSSTLQVELSETEDFRTISATGAAVASPATDHCAQLRIEGLQPDRWYFYRFLAPDGSVSPTGRTRTLPGEGIERLRMAVMSCANATSGWFNAYAHAAARDDLDLVVHLGDYIYESPVDRSDALVELAVGRGIAPLGETVSLLDYRLRYASYRADPALQELHRRHPMIVIWDDHEVANNSWQNGANNHDPGDGDWDIRKRAAMQAFYEWLPMDARAFSSYRIGNLATLFRLETRLLARSRQLDISTALAGAPDPSAAASAFLNGPLADSSRTMMGAGQEKWLAEGLLASVAAQTRWQVLLQQVIMAPTLMPRIDASWFAPEIELGAAEQRRIAVAGFLSSQGMPFGLDRWDGYPAARERLLSASRRAGANLLVLSGDSHNAWAYNLEHEGAPAGVELAAQSVSSLGLDKRFGGDPAHIANEFVAANPGLRWCDTSRRGYMDLTLTRDVATCEWLFLGSRSQLSKELIGTQQMFVEHGARRLAQP